MIVGKRCGRCVKMEDALTPEQVPKMRGFLRLWLCYGNVTGEPSATKFLYAWRRAEFGRVYNCTMKTKEA